GKETTYYWNDTTKVQGTLKEGEMVHIKSAEKDGKMTASWVHVGKMEPKNELRRPDSTRTGGASGSLFCCRRVGCLRGRRPHRLTVRTGLFQGRSTGSIPVGAATLHHPQAPNGAILIS